MRKERKMKRYNRVSSVLVLSCLVLVLSAGGAPAAYQYNVTVLPSLGGMDTEALGMNDLNQVVGWSNRPNSDVCYPCLWTNPTTVVDLGYVIGNAKAVAINNVGQIVGEDYGTGHGFFYENGTKTDLGTLPGGTSSVAFAINNAGQVVGVADNALGYARAFQWDKVNGMCDLGPLSAHAISDSGQIVGETWDTMNYYSALWPKDSTSPTIISGEEAYDVNASGQVILRDWSNQGFLWENGQLTSLGVLAGCDYCNPKAINISGSVVGNCFGDWSPSVPFVWAQQEGMIDLNTLIIDKPFDVKEANDINNYGNIVGTTTGYPEAVLLVRAPEPSTFVLLITGLIVTGLIFLVLRKRVTG
jgi:probable HAF family extracellular repeat protein